ncbi:MAG: hypothetical protein JOZ25_09305 [Actinobacteria bacterium]|nr:hypothetical protein [Actinomycetota bacterium]
MEYDEQADEMERQAGSLEEASGGLKDDIEEAGSDWEARKSDTSVPGAADAEAAGPHNLEAEDPATGERKGEERAAERDDALRSDAERDISSERDEGE